MVRQVTVINAYGEEIYSAEPASAGPQYELDLSDQPNGVYFLKIKLGEELINKKVYIMQ